MGEGGQQRHNASRDRVTAAGNEGCRFSVGQWLRGTFCYLAVSFAGGMSQTLIVWSPPAEASVFPSGPNATDSTPEVCPRNVAHSFLTATSQSLTVWSLLPDARVLPSGLNATDRTKSVWP